jgi:hypothetical protein
MSRTVRSSVISRLAPSPSRSDGANTVLLLLDGVLRVAASTARPPTSSGSDPPPPVPSLAVIHRHPLFAVPPSGEGRYAPFATILFTSWNV